MLSWFQVGDWVMLIAGYIVLGFLAGIFSGLVGIGGGTIIVPVLVFMFKMGQQQAQGTTLALMVPPIGLLAAWQYYKQGYVDIKVGALICAGFVLGGYFGANIATALPSKVLEKIFGVAMLLISLKMIFSR